MIYDMWCFLREPSLTSFPDTCNELLHRTGTGPAWVHSYPFPIPSDCGNRLSEEKKVQELQRRLLGWVLAAQPITRTGVWIPALITNSASTNASNYSPVGFDTLFWPPCMHRRATPTYACMYTQTHTHNKNKTILKSQRGIIGDFCLCKRNLVYHSGLM